MNKNDNDLEADSSEKAWKYYKEKYPMFKIDEEYLYSENKRLVGFFEYNNNTIVHVNKNNIKNKTNIIKLGGDCFFNFNNKKKDKFKNWIDEENKGLYKKCCDNHHSNMNFVLMPVTGGMNRVKGKIYYKKTSSSFFVHEVGRPPINMYDRPDTFIYYLSKFFEIKKMYLKNKMNLEDVGLYFSNSIFTESMHTMNLNELYNFMNIFTDIYQFTNLFYGMDLKFTDRMIKNGMKPLTDENIKEYMELAQEFWALADQT